MKAGNGESLLPLGGKPTYSEGPLATDRTSSEARGAQMPTKYSAQLDYAGFDWTKDGAFVRQRLMASKDSVASAARFKGDEAALISFIDGICGILCWAAAIQINGGFKAANRITATLEAVAKDPSVISTGRVEPEALGAIASQYQRAGETPGKFGLDVYQDQGAHELNLQQVSRAAMQAIIQLKTEAAKGRPKKPLLDVLCEKLRDLFLRHNPVATRHSIASDGKVAQVEAGPYLEFCETVITPLNEFFSKLPRSYNAKPISAAQVARKRKIARGSAANR